MSGDSIVVGPRSAAELREFAAQPEPPMPTESEVSTMLGKLAIATAQPKVSPAEAKERLAMYWLALRDLPVADLRSAFVKIIKTKTFLPTPAEVRAAAIQAGANRKYAKSRAKHLAWLHDREWTPPKDHVPAEELKALVSGVKFASQ